MPCAGFSCARGQEAHMKDKQDHLGKYVREHV